MYTGITYDITIDTTIETFEQEGAPGFLVT